MKSEGNLYFLQKKWHGWIPTNLGELQFEYITQEQNQTTYPIIDFEQNNDKKEIILTIDARKISDSIKYYELFVDDPDWEEVYAKTATIRIKRESEKFSGTIELHFANEVVVSADFYIKLDGKVEFSNLEYNVWDICSLGDVDFHRLALYILLKSVIHGDNHHHQKIDVALKITVDDFYPKIILHNLLIHIKSIERNIKRLNNCASKIDAQKAYHEMEGYISYCKSFYEIFKKEIEAKDEHGKDQDDYLALKLLYQNLDSIKNSAKAKIDKYDRQNTFTRGFTTTLLALSALFVSMSILNKSLSTPEDHKYLFYSIPLLLILVEGCYIDYTFRAIHFYNDYEMMKYLQYVDTKNLNTRGNINQKILFILRYITPILLFIYIIYSIWPIFIDNMFQIIWMNIQIPFKSYFFLSLYSSIIIGLWTIAAILGWRLNPEKA